MGDAVEPVERIAGEHPAAGRAKEFLQSPRNFQKSRLVDDQLPGEVHQEVEPIDIDADGLRDLRPLRLDARPIALIRRRGFQASRRRGRGRDRGGGLGCCGGGLRYRMLDDGGAARRDHPDARLDLDVPHAVHVGQSVQLTEVAVGRDPDAELGQGLHLFEPVSGRLGGEDAALGRQPGQDKFGLHVWPGQIRLEDEGEANRSGRLDRLARCGGTDRCSVLRISRRG